MEAMARRIERVEEAMQREDLDDACAALGWTFGLTQGDSATPSAVLAKEEPLPPPLLTLLTAYGLSVLVTGCM